jgi:GAF domain-containing protein
MPEETRMTLEPLPETNDALRSIGAWSEHDLLDEMTLSARLVEGVVPSVVGLSVSLVREDLTFTMVSSSPQIAALDGTQYAFGGPCVDAVHEDATLAAGKDASGLLSEDRWATFARIGAAHGILSTLSMPVHTDGRVTGGVNFYASTSDAFDGHHDELAAIMGAWAPGAVRDADLEFSTRAAAERAPQRLEDRSVLDQATGVVMAERHVDEETARSVLADAASRAGVADVDVARAVIRPLQTRSGALSADA